nr:MAG TPA: hypothetical protein [Caudoviricetes sp.]
MFSELVSCRSRMMEPGECQEGRSGVQGCMPLTCRRAWRRYWPRCVTVCITRSGRMNV